MKVAHLDTGREWRGGQQQVLWLMEGLAKRGVENLLLAPAGPLLERARAAGLAATEWNARGEWDVPAVLAARRALRAFTPGVVHLHSAHAHALGVPAAGAHRAKHGPKVVVSRRVDFRVGGNPLSWLKYRLPVDRYFCISRGVMDVMREGGVPAEKLALVPSGVRFTTLEEVAAAGDLRVALRLPPEARLIGTVAALAPHKDHANLLRAAAKVAGERADAHFVWVGEGECREKIEAERRAYGLEGRIHLAGFREGARAMIPQFELFVISSYLEGLCTSIIDAQSLGVPVVATRTGGIPDLVEDGVNGWLVPPRDPEALATGILAALADPAEARRRSEAAVATVRAFSDEAMVERSLAEYHRILETAGP